MSEIKKKSSMNLNQKIRAVVHVGLHKTGTTALQSALFRNVDKLEEQGFLYITQNGTPNHSGLAAAFLKSNFSAAQAIVNRMHSKANEDGAHTIIISSEMFSEHPIDTNYFKEIFKDFDVEVIAYLRRSDDMILSAYNELVRDNVSRWTTTIAQRLPYDPTFRNVIGKWLHDPAWKFTIAPYDRPQWKNGSLLVDFLSMIDVDVTKFNHEAIEEKVNTSLPSQLLEILRLANMLDINKHDRDKLIEILYRISKDKTSSNELHEINSDFDRRKYRQMIVPYLEKYRPYFRANFDDRFLLSDILE